jgi:hypothetical protein
MNEKEFQKLKGWVDYDRVELPSLNKSQKIRYFCNKRVKYVLLNPLDEMYQSLMKEKNESSILLCFANCICCSIEAFGKFYTGKTGQSGNNFKEFVKKYMHSNYVTQRFNSKRYVDILWNCFRNGLAHGFTIKNGGFEHNLKELFKIKNIRSKKQLVIDPTLFYRDFRKGVRKYIQDLKKSKLADPIYKNFDKTFTEIFIKGK